jgi:predicted GNAT superfamily acetyltransferase
MSSVNAADLSRIHVHGGAKFLLRVETSSQIEDYTRYDDIRNAIWDFPEDHLSGCRGLLGENYFHDGTSLFIGVFEVAPGGGSDVSPGRMIGFSYGFVGVRDKSVGFRSLDNLWFYSQYTGIMPEMEGFGLGLAIKEFQRDILRRLYGIGTVVCTFDPLTAVNAHRNFLRLGMRVLEYRPAIYGEFGGRLNRRDVPSDRFFMAWDIGSDGLPGDGAPLEPAGEGPCILSAVRRTVNGRSGPAAIETAGVLSFDGVSDSVLMRIPADFYAVLMETDVEDPEVRRIPLIWRLRTREAFQTLLGRGFRVAGFLDVLPGETGPGYILRRC